MRARCAFFLAALSAMALPGRSIAQLAVHPEFPVPNGPVYASALSGDTLYIGGSFSGVTQPTAAIGVDATYGSLLPSPRVIGSVLAVVSDGAGGWYLGGHFKRVGSLTCTHLAHVHADGTPYAWAPVVDSTVVSLLRDGSTLFVGGHFSHVEGATRVKLAAIELGTGAVHPWTADVASGPAQAGVTDMALAGGVLYLGGAFDSIAGAPRANLAAVDLTSGALLPWAPQADGYVSAISASDSIVFVGGGFDSVGGVPRARFAVLNATTGEARQDWPEVTAGTHVLTLATDANRLYMGGRFTAIGGHPRAGLAAIELASRQVSTWDPALGGIWTNTVNDLVLTDEAVFAAGSVDGRTLVEFDKLTGYRAPWWYPLVPGDISALALFENALYCGGYQLGIRQSRTNLAAINIRTGDLLGWSPFTNGVVRAVTAGGGMVYVSGSFTAVDGETREGLAQLHGDFGGLTTWNPGLAPSGSFANALLLVGDTLYVGGQFSGLGGVGRSSLGSVNATNGAVTNWVANANGTVSSLSRSGNMLHVGGSFASLAGQPRPRLGSFDLSTGLLSSWNPQPNQPVQALATVGGTVFVAGSFSAVAGQPRQRLAAFDVASGSLLPWNPSPSSSVNVLASTDSSLIAGGAFLSIGGQSRSRLAELRLDTGAAMAWRPMVSGGTAPINAISSGPGVIAIGGSLGGVDGWSLPNLAVFTAPPVNTSAPPASMTSRVVLLQNFPNPVRQATTIRFRLSEFGPARIGIYDLQGRLLRVVLAAAALAPGDHAVRLDVTGLRAGAYWYRLEADNGAASRRLVVTP